MSPHPRGQGATVQPKPLGCLSVELVPCEFIDNEATTCAQQAADLVEDDAQALNMMERETRDCHVEPSGFLQIFDPTTAEDPAVRSSWIDCHDVIAGAVQRSREPTTSTSHFEDASRRGWQL